LSAVGDLARAVDGAEVVTLATPSQVLRPIVKSARASLRPGAAVVVATKGLERGTLSLMTEVAAEELPDATVVALSGPSFAAEVVARQPTAVVVASDQAEAAETVQRTFSSPYFRAYTHSDVVGVELGGALKNVMAVATGIAEGLGLGFNARAALITRGLAEMTRLGVALGAEQSTFAGLAGLGDLVLTCTGSLSRNRAVGLEIGKGAKLDDVLKGTETVAEGVVTAQSARELASREGVEMPIVDAVNRVLFEGQSARSGISALMTRELRSEVDE
jgi:glycerol-3-phosphate dehydrogenase (NAD(P)+)